MMSQYHDSDSNSGLVLIGLAEVTGMVKSDQPVRHSHRVAVLWSFALQHSRAFRLFIVEATVALAVLH
jgi:hypothetical protein